jgi:hypothetical protein
VGALVLVHGHLTAQLINQFGDDLLPDSDRRRGRRHADTIIGHDKAGFAFTCDSQRNINGTTYRRT